MTYVSHADLGGKLGYGPVVDEPEGEYFHRAWQPRALAVNLAAGALGRWNIDMSRRYRETLPDYAELSYYQIWISALERMLIDRGVITAAELVEGRSMRDPEQLRVLRADDVDRVLRSGRPADRPVDSRPRFGAGDRVVMTAVRPDHHTRVPGYVAGATGVVERVHGAHVFPDTNAHDLGEDPQWLYTVVFDATALWDDAAPGQTVSVDAWESYLSPAGVPQ